MHDYKTILRYQAQGLSIRKSAELLSASRNTVSDILKLCETVEMTYEKSLSLTNEEIYRQLYPDKADGFNIYVVPDFEYIHKELTRPGVTLSLLWEEYVEQAKKMVIRIFEQREHKGRREWNEFKNAVRDELSGFIYRKTRRSPMILPIIMEI